MMDFLKTPVFGILLSVVCYEIGILIQRKTKNPILNPLLLAIILVILVLTVFDIPKETYDLGGSSTTSEVGSEIARLVGLV